MYRNIFRGYTDIYIHEGHVKLDMIELSGNVGEGFIFFDIK